jgi:hypothetical protein
MIAAFADTQQQQPAATGECCLGTSTSQAANCRPVLNCFCITDRGDQGISPIRIFFFNFFTFQLDVTGHGVDVYRSVLKRRQDNR